MDRTKSFKVENPTTGETKSVTLEQYEKDKLNEKGFEPPFEIVDGVKIDVRTGAPVSPKGNIRPQGDLGTPSVHQMGVSGGPKTPTPEEIKEEQIRITKQTDEEVERANKERAIKGEQKK